MSLPNVVGGARHDVGGARREVVPGKDLLSHARKARSGADFYTEYENQLSMKISPMSYTVGDHYWY